MGYYFTSESVSEGHPDKVCDQISDAVLDEILRYDPTSKVACETLVTTGLVVVAGEIRTNAYVEIQDITRRVINRIGYNKSEYQFDAQSCGVFSALHGQSNDIFMGVGRENPEEQGAGDQGMMFGFACKETENYMPLTIDLSHLLLRELAAIRHEGKQMKYLRPDAKSQVTVEYEEGWKPLRIDTIVISTQHDEFVKPVDDTPEAQREADQRMVDKIEADVLNILLPRVKRKLPAKLRKLFDQDMKIFVNPPESSSSEALTATAASQVAKSSSIPTADEAPMAAGLSPERTPPKSIARQPTPRAILPRTWWPQVFATKPWCRLPTPSASPNPWAFTLIPREPPR